MHFAVCPISHHNAQFAHFVESELIKSAPLDVVDNAPNRNTKRNENRCIAKNQKFYRCEIATRFDDRSGMSLVQWMVDIICWYSNVTMWMVMGHN